uniref:Uncharacterized protein n=1 Tax=Graphocephala atropunctata TaxID=36148 RepID=A0A1B6LWP7_9HEMI
MCIPGLEVSSWSCLCSQGMLLDEDNITCISTQQQALTGPASAGDALQAIDYGSCSVTLDSDSLLYAHNYVITLQAVSSYQPRDLEEERVKVSTTTFPVTIESLQPATSYSVIVEPQPTYLGVWRTKVSTCLPPLQVTRLPQVYKPSNKLQVPWLESQQFFDLTYSWDPLVRQYYLLIFLQGYLVDMDQVNYVIQPRVLIERIKSRLNEMNVTDIFYVVHKYQNKVEFDRDTEMYLDNTPYNVEFFLAMVQVSKYDEAFSVDIVLSEKTSIPFPNSGNEIPGARSSPRSGQLPMRSF